MMTPAVIVAPATVRYDSCGRNNRAGNPCGRPAGWGTDHAGAGACKLHGGTTPSGRKHAAFLTARQQLERLTLEPLTPEQYIDPIGALLHAVTIAAMMEAACREQVMALESWTGDIYSLTKDGDRVPTSEESRAVVRLHVQWHDQLVKAGKACAAAKIDERVTRLHEAQGSMLNTAFRLFLADMAAQHPEAFTAAIQKAALTVFAARIHALSPKSGAS